jgi:hypothetical protein
MWIPNPRLGLVSRHEDGCQRAPEGDVPDVLGHQIRPVDVVVVAGVRFDDGR